MTEYSFFKFSGAGNTFAIAWSSLVNQSIKPQQIMHIANPVNGFSVDGVLVVTKHSEREYSWDFYNSDGSRAEMCGNAARCVALFLKMSGLEKEVKLNTLAGSVFLNPNKVTVEMREKDFEYKNKSLQLDGKNYEGLSVEAGVPHFLINNYNLTKEICQSLRYHKEFSPRGSNITLYEMHSKNEIKAKTYERGVENFTLACGTGALAVGGAFLSSENQNEVFIHMPGGRLKVEKLKVGYCLSGDTAYVGSFKINI